MNLVCGKCKEEKPCEQFHKRTKSKTGYAPWCKLCHKQYDEERYKHVDKEQRAVNRRTVSEEKLNYIVKYLEEHPCITCGEKDIVVLEFDHRDRDTKSYSISNMLWTHSIKSIQKEIDKCDVLCANCHRKRTAIQLGWRKAFLSE